MKQVFLYGGIMAVLSAALLFFYSNSGRFSNTTAYAEIQNNNEVLNAEDTDVNKNHSRTDSGMWYSNKWEMYHTLSFGAENSLMIDNHVDTLFRYKYMLVHDTLWIVKGKTNLIANKIKYANNDELVFESFLDAKKEMKYSRINKSSKK